jgi:hypothetical protein
VIIFFVQFFENLRLALIFGLLFPRKKLCLSFDENGLGYILADFVTNLSRERTLGTFNEQSLDDVKEMILFENKSRTNRQISHSQLNFCLEKA